MKKIIISVLLMFTLCSCNFDEPKQQNELNARVQEDETNPTVPNEDLPIVPDSALYPAHALNELVQKEAEYIFYGKIIKEEKSAYTEFYTAYTPVVISVIETVKGEPVKEFTLNRDGGKFEEYIALSSSGYEWAVGMECFFFVNKDGWAMGPTKIWPVADGNVALCYYPINSFNPFDDLVINDYDYGIKYTEFDLLNHDVGKMILKSVSYDTCFKEEYGEDINIKDLKKDAEFMEWWNEVYKTCSVDDFIDLIKSLV